MTRLPPTPYTPAEVQAHLGHAFFFIGFEGPGGDAANECLYRALAAHTILASPPWAQVLALESPEIIAACSGNAIGAAPGSDGGFKRDCHILLYVDRHHGPRRTVKTLRHELGHQAAAALDGEGADAWSAACARQREAWRDAPPEWHYGALYPHAFDLRAFLGSYTPEQQECEALAETFTHAVTLRPDLAPAQWDRMEALYPHPTRAFRQELLPLFERKAESLYRAA